MAENRTGEANTLNTIGWFHTQLGDYRQTLAFCRQALRLHRRLEHREGRATTLRNIGHAHHRLGDRGAAEAARRQALAVLDDLHHPDADRVRAKLR